MNSLKSAIFLALFLVVGCTSEEKNKPNTAEKKQNTSVLDNAYTVVKDLKREDGIHIEWYKLGSKEKIQDGDLLQIDFKVKLKDGTVVDGNHLLKNKKKSLPFLVGFGMQTAGWDIALKELSVGDFARIILPSQLARGEKGIPGLIPPNADNVLFIRVLKKEKPNRVVDGTKVYLLEENTASTVTFSSKSTILFHGIASSPTSAMFVNTFRTNTPFSYDLDSYGLTPGLRKALINAKKADRMYVVVPPEQAYGKKGYLNFVRPNESIFYNILVMDVVKK
jgi:FKBP-type peptidyl-prolyl cis-trans isomerase